MATSIAEATADNTVIGVIVTFSRSFEKSHAPMVTRAMIMLNSNCVVPPQASRCGFMKASQPHSSTPICGIFSAGSTITKKAVINRMLRI